MNMLCIGLVAMAATMLFGATLPVFAQDSSSSDDAKTEQIKAETERLKAETDKINAQADRDRVRITSLNLPSYEGKTTLNAGAGDMEAMLLTTSAVRDAGKQIAKAAEAEAAGKKILLLTQNDVFDFGLAGSIAAEIDGLKQQYKRVWESYHRPTKTLSAPVAIISAIAGLVRSEREISPANAPVADSMLLVAIARHLYGRAILPGSAIGTINTSNSDQSPLLNKLSELVRIDTAAGETLKNLEVDKEKNKTEIADIEAVRARFGAFFVRVTTADSQGIVAITRAARLEHLANDAVILRAHVEKSGGSLISSKNIATFFGSDPVRVTGGLVVSYTVTDPSEGAVMTAGILACRTTVAKLRAVQERKLFERNTSPPDCESIAI